MDVILQNLNFNKLLGFNYVYLYVNQFVSANLNIVFCLTVALACYYTYIKFKNETSHFLFSLNASEC